MARKKQRKSEWLVDSALPADAVPRRVRVEGDVHQVLVRALRGMGDERLRSAAISRVQMTEDLQLASVYVRPAITTSESNAAAIVAALNSAKKRIRKELGTSLSLRYTPDLRFFYDRGHDAAKRVDELLAEIAADRASQPGEASGEAASADDTAAVDTAAADETASDETAADDEVEREPKADASGADVSAADASAADASSDSGTPDHG